MKEKIYQDNYILKHCVYKTIKRRRQTTGTRPPKEMNIIYYIRSKSDKLIRVCKKAFLRILRINEGRVKGILKRYKKTGNIAYETRGGDRKCLVFKDKNEYIKKFVQTLKPVESHYCRNKSERLYLSSGLNIRILYKHYVEKCLEDSHEEFIVKESYFRFVFNTKFNIGFSSPKTDVCSKCTELKERIKNEKDSVKNNSLKNELKIHKLRANAFYDFLREDKPDLKILTFDCQKNQILPKIPDQLAYYSRQLYIFNFTVVEGHSNSKLSRENVHIYTWNENDFPKGPNEISSCLYHRLNNTNLDNVRTLRLMADGCSSQNKNFILLGMLMKWFKNSTSTLKEVQLIFPIPGHSFIPPDRVFAGIEKKIKKQENIILPEEYIKIYKESGSIYQLGKDLFNNDWKVGVRSVLKQSSALHFKFNKCKRFILRRGKSDILVRGEVAYKNDLGMMKKITKFSMSTQNIELKEINMGYPVKILKLNDIYKLLSKHFGEDWKSNETLAFYKNLSELTVDNHDNPDEHELNHLCDTNMENISEMFV